MQGNAHFQSTVQKFLLSRFLKYCFLASLFAVFCLPSAGSAAEKTSDRQSVPSFFSSLMQRLREPEESTANQPETAATTAAEPEVVVVGSRLDSVKVPFADVPANVSYIPANTTQKNAGEIHEARIPDFQSALEEAESSVLYDQVGNGVDATYGLRGFNNGSSVIVLLDGVRVNELDGNGVDYPLLDMSDVDSLQIDRGSASPIYGSGAFGGVVHLTTREPSTKPVNLFGGLEFSSYKGIQFYQGFSGTLPDQWTPLGGEFKYYFRGGRKVGDGFRDNGEYRISSFNMKASYELPGRGRFYVGLKHVADAVSNPGAISLRQYEENAEQTVKPLDGRHFKNSIFNIGGDAYFFEKRLTLSLMTSVRPNRVHFYTTSATFPDFTFGFDPDTSLVTTKSNNIDGIWQAAYQDSWGWLSNQTILGMELQTGSYLGVQQNAFRGNVNEGLPRDAERSARPQSWSLYWRESPKLFDKIIPHVGMRYDFHRLKTTDFITPSDSLSRTFQNLSWTTGLTVKPFSWNDLFANYSQGFRVPDISELAPFSGTISSGLQPVKSDSYEVGGRVRLLDDKLKLKSSFFLIDLKDDIAFDSNSVSTVAPFGQNINIGQSRRDGIESRVDFKPIPETSFYGSYTWTQAYVRETDPAGSLVDGRTIGQIPENRFTVGTTLKPFARSRDLLSGLRLSFNGIFTGHQHPQNYESTSEGSLNAVGGSGHWIKAYSVWNMMLSYTFKHQQIYFGVANLFNERYYSRAVVASSFNTSLFPGDPINGTPYTFVNPGAPREFQLGVKWEL